MKLVQLQESLSSYGKNNKCSFPGGLQAKVSFAGNFSDLPANDTDEYSTLKDEFAVAFASSLQVAKSLVQVLGFEPGSIIVKLEIIAKNGTQLLEKLENVVNSKSISVVGYPVQNLTG